MTQINQPQYGQQALNETGEWKHGLCSCCESCGDCCCSCWCPCIYAVMASDATGNEDNKMLGYITSATTLIFGTSIPFFLVRRNVREQKGISGSLAEDFICVCCCSCCVMVQVKREFDLD